MTTQPTSDPVERLARTYERADGVAADAAPAEPRGALPPKSPEEKLADTYREQPGRTEQPGAPAAPEHALPPKDPIEKLANTYNTEQPADAKQDDAPFEIRSPIEGVGPDLLNVFGDAARGIGMPQSQAQALVDKIVPELLARAQQEHAAATAKLVEAARADPVLRSGAGFDRNIAIADQAIGRFGDPELREWLKQGAGNVPAVIRFFVRVARATSGFRMRPKDEQGNTDA